MAARKKSRRTEHAASGDRTAQAMRDSAHKIWLAGLGAFERARSEGPKMFETLVAQGRELRGRASDAADQALKSMREQAGGAQGKWDKLEQVFEERVGRSLHRLGVLTKAEVGDLSRQVQELNASVRSMMTRGGAKASTRKAKAPKARKAKRAKRR